MNAWQLAAASIFDQLKGRQHLHIHVLSLSLTKSIVLAPLEGVYVLLVLICNILSLRNIFIVC